jgi:hypothetical protein
MNDDRELQELLAAIFAFCNLKIAVGLKPSGGGIVVSSSDPRIDCKNVGLIVKQDPPCSGPGYAHKAHGNCPGYGTDRT